MTITRLVLAAFAAGTAPFAQTRETPNTKDVELRARRLVRWLSIPEQRAAAVSGLYRLGENAVPALARSLRGPRKEVWRHASQGGLVSVALRR